MKEILIDFFTPNIFTLALALAMIKMNDLRMQQLELIEDLVILFIGREPEEFMDGDKDEA